MAIPRKKTHQFEIPSTPKLTPKIELRIVERAILSRVVDERLLSLFGEGRLSGTVHTCIGQEFTGALVAEFLQPGDAIFSNHRCHGHFLSIVNDVEGLIAELMGRQTGVCGGIGGSQHLCKNGFYSNGIQGSIVPVTAGLALARKIQKKSHIAVVFVGDGTLGEGALYETLNLASKWQLPFLMILENNLYSQSTHQSQTLAGDICQRAKAFGIETFQGSTWDWKPLYDLLAQAILRTRREQLPAFVQIDTYRLKAHSKGDDTRERSEVERYEAKDPLTQLISKSQRLQEIVKSTQQRVEKAVHLADSAPFTVLNPEPKLGPTLEWSSYRPSDSRMLPLLNQCFHQVFKDVPEALCFGEDIESPYGGAFKVTKGLSDAFPDRVWNTPLCELSLCGVGAGLAMEGYRPFVEIMFGDFLGLAFDQILNSISKFEQMYNDQVKVNLVIRTPMGGGRGYGPTHSQTLDPYFLGIPGLQILALNHLIDPDLVYRPLVEKDCGPTLVLENKLLYGSQMAHHCPQGFEIKLSNGLFPTALVKPNAPTVDVTFCVYGGLSRLILEVAETLFDEHDLISQIVCPTRIYPFDIQPLVEVFNQSRYIVFVEEGQGFAGFASESIAQLAEFIPNLSGRIKRIFPPRFCIPASPVAEAQILPSKESILKTVVQLAYER